MKKDDANKDMDTLDAVINKAAQHLPEGYRINIMVENGGYCVQLQSPNGDVEEMDGGDGFISDINEGICIANGFVD